MLRKLMLPTPPIHTLKLPVVLIKLALFTLIVAFTLMSFTRPTAVKAQDAIVIHLTRSLVALDEGTAGYFALHLDQPPAPGERITVTPLSSDPAQILVYPVSRTFTSLNWNALRTFTLTSVDDTASDSGESHIVRFLIQSSIGGAQILSIRAVDVYVTDND